MKQVFLKDGSAIVEDVPPPVSQTGMVLVRSEYSCISTGTEMKSFLKRNKPLFKLATENPNLVKKVLQRARDSGIIATSKFVFSRLAAEFALGYSSAGCILEIGDGVRRFKQGECVACGGGGYANHAEIICVPENLTVKVPEGVSLLHASTVALGTIALQGVRRANPTLGETFAVIGLGVLGQLTVQLLKANGCRVIGLDLAQDRIELAKKIGMDFGLNANAEDSLVRVLRITDAVGADGIIVTASTPSHDVISKAFQMCRKKGRVVVVGEVGLNLKREDIYKKELDFFISTSYGPGRYHESYEEKGVDYPIAYVRWTENRNMKEYLRLLDEAKVNVEPLISAIYPIDKANDAYISLRSKEKKPLLVILRYPSAEKQVDKLKYTYKNYNIKIGSDSEKVRLAVVGAGSFAKGMHLPNISKLKDIFLLRAIITRNGHNAKETASQFGAAYYGTDYQAVLDDPEIDAVLIATRHNLHAKMTFMALQADKHVFVEKPLSINMKEMRPIIEFYKRRDESKLPILLVGFNRRFSPFMTYLKKFTENRLNPMILNYRMNSGYIPSDHWVHGAEGGGRNIGEACHIYDLFTFLTEARIKNVHVSSINSKSEYYMSNDNFVATLQFFDGSVATLIYTALGNKRYPKEHLEAYIDGNVFTVSDYKILKCYGIKEKTIQARRVDKGQQKELESFGKAILKGEPLLIPLWQQFQAMEISFKVEQNLSSYNA